MCYQLTTVCKYKYEFIHNKKISPTNSANNFIINVHDQLNDYDEEETMLTIHQIGEITNSDLMPDILEV